MGRVHFTKALDNIERLSRKAAAAEKSLAKDHRVFFLFQSMLKTLNLYIVTIWSKCMNFEEYSGNSMLKSIITNSLEIDFWLMTVISQYKKVGNKFVKFDLQG